MEGTAMTKTEVLKRIEELTPEQMKVVEEVLESFHVEEQERPRRRISFRGKYKHVLTSSEEFMRRKQEEKELEERRWR